MRPNVSMVVFTTCRSRLAVDEVGAEGRVSHHRGGNLRAASRDACPTQAGDLANRGCAPVVIEQPAESQSLNGLQVGALVAGGVGVVGMGTFAIAGLMSRNLAKDTTGKCNEDRECPAGVDIDQAQKDEKRLNLIANIGVGVGAAGLAGGLILFLLSTEPDSSTQEAGQVAWQVAPTKGGAWVGVSGAF